MSLLTGESVPVEVGPGDDVAGATVNAGGRLVVRATRVGADTALAQISRLVTEAQSGKAPVQRLADRISGVFVPVVIAIAVATLGFWLGAGESSTFAFTAAVAVLIIACPCALGLATPTALLVGTGRGARLGLLIRGPEILESTRRVDTDPPRQDRHRHDRSDDARRRARRRRASTRTRRSPWSARSRTPPSIRSLAPSPPARASAGLSLAPVEGFTNREGLGVEGVVDGHAVIAGRPALLADWAEHLRPSSRRSGASSRRAAGPSSPPAGTARRARSSRSPTARRRRAPRPSPP